MRALEELVFSANQFLQNDCGFTPQRSRLFLHTNEEYRRWCKEHGLLEHSDGVYIPQTFEAHINLDVRPALAILHEYFGHGLFCEYAKIGEKIVDGTVDKPIIEMSENVAIWIEHRLAKELSLQQEWREKYGDGVPTLARMEQLYGPTIVWFHHDFPKIYDAHKIDEIMTLLYKEHHARAKLVLLYGSRKPHSDIDVFMVSDENIEDENNHWLDVHIRDSQYVEEGVAKWDITIVDPLITGELVRGDIAYLQELRSRIAKGTNVDVAIAHNKACSIHKYNWAMQHAEGSLERAVGLRTARVHAIVAEDLLQGRMPRTLEEIKQRYEI